MSYPNVPREYVDDPYLADTGKPSLPELERITNWPIYSRRDIINLLGYVQVRWFFGNAFDDIPLADDLFEIDTRRWPGNVALVQAMRSNTTLWRNIFKGSNRIEGTDHDIYTLATPWWPEIPDDANGDGTV